MSLPTRRSYYPIILLLLLVFGTVSFAGYFWLFGTETLASLSYSSTGSLFTSVLKELEKSHASGRNINWFNTTGVLESDWILQTPGGEIWGKNPMAIKPSIPCAPSDPCTSLGVKHCLSDADCQPDGGACALSNASRQHAKDRPARACLASTDIFYERMFRLIVTAETSIDVVSLSDPTGRFQTALINALTVVNESGHHPRVRLLFGGSDPRWPNALTSASARLETYLNALKKLNPGFSLPLAYGWLSNSLMSWNHAKMIVVDAREAMVGGENLIEEAYLGPKPVFDLSLSVSGEAVLAARRFIDTLWSQDNLVLATTANFTLEKPIAFPSPRTLLSHLKRKSVPILALGDLGAAGDGAGMAALQTLIGSAKHTIRIAQQDLFNPLLNPLFPKPTPVIDALSAALLRGVDIQIVKSNLNGNDDFGMLSTEKTRSLVVEYIRHYSESQGPRPTLEKELCAHLHVASFRFGLAESWPDGMPFGLHTKLVLVDEEAFYIGSQNLYPAALQEFGYMIFDAKKAEELMAAYWRPMWAASARTVEACEASAL